MNNESPRSILAEPHVANLLLLLLDRKQIQARDLMLVNRNYAKIIQVARGLEVQGLIEIEEMRSPRLTYIFRLTPKGKKVAEKLKEIEEIIG